MAPVNVVEGEETSERREAREGVRRERCRGLGRICRQVSRVIRSQRVGGMTDS
jgi:hypothetical protein